MNDKGYSREKKGIKFLVLYILYHLREAVPVDVIAEAAMTDSTVGYIPLMECVDEMVKSGHILRLEDEQQSQSLYCIANAGIDSLKAYGTMIRYSVREKAGSAAMAAYAKIRHKPTVKTSTVRKAERHFVTTLILSDGTDEIMHLEMLTVNEEQGAMLENKFRENADKIYNRVLTDLLQDYKGVEKEL